jgi:hypothetical protein
LLQAAVPVKLFARPWWWWAGPVALLAWWAWDRRSRWALMALGCFGLAMLTVSWMLPHYVAPAAALAGIVFVNAWRRLRALPGGLLPARLVWLVAGLCVFLPRPVESWAEERASIGAGMERRLMLVRYAPAHSPHEEWVHNGADLDTAPVVWAREGDPRLLEHFRDRQIWLVEPDTTPVKLTRLR